MPIPLNDNQLSDKSLLQLLAWIKTDITEISNSMLMLIQYLCRDENTTFLKTHLDLAGFEELQGLKKALQEYAEQGVTNPIELAQKVFQGGVFPRCYQFATHLEMTYKRVLHGLALDEKILFQCLDDIINFDYSPGKTDVRKVDTFRGTLVSWTKALLDIPSDIVIPEPLKLPFSTHRATLQHISTITENFNKVLEQILSRLVNVLCVQLIHNAHQQNCIEDSVIDSKTLVEVLMQHPLTAETYRQLRKRITNADTTLSSLEETYRNEYRNFLEVNTLHSEVHRLHYYNQCWNPSTRIVHGLCAGGIRFWSRLQATTQPTPLQIDKPTLQHMSWVDNQILYHYQLNQTGFDTVKNSGDHFIFSLCTVEKKFMVKGKSSQMTERYHRLVEMQFRDIEKYFKIYPHNTLELALSDPLNKISGHAVGFKCQQHGNKIYYYFCDFNSGVFFSESLLDLREWFKAYFLHMGYHTLNYTKYEIHAIVPKTAMQQFNSSFSRCVEALASMSTVEIGHTYPKTASAMLLLSRMQALTRLSSEERQDDSYRTQIKSLYARSKNADDKDAFLLQQEILEIYHKIKHPVTPDHFIAWLVNNYICETLQSSMKNEQKNLLESIYVAASFIKYFKEANPQYDVLEILILMQQAKIFLKFPDLNKTEAGIAALEEFCDKVANIKAENVIDPEGYTKLQVFKGRLLLAFEEKNTLELSGIAEEIDEALTDPSLWMNSALYELWTSVTHNGLIDNIAFENVEHNLNTHEIKRDP